MNAFFVGTGVASRNTMLQVGHYKVAQLYNHYRRKNEAINVIAFMKRGRRWGVERDPLTAQYEHVRERHASVESDSQTAPY